MAHSGSVNTLRCGGLCLVVQVHSAQLESMQELTAQTNKESSARQGQMESLQKQLADMSSQVSSLTVDLKTARQTPNIAVQVLLHA